MTRYRSRYIAMCNGRDELDKFVAQLCWKIKNPLVLVFAGQSGHVKAELTRKLGEMMLLDLEIVDCTIPKDNIGIFGARCFYRGEPGSPP